MEERISKKISPFLQGQISSNDFLNSLDKDEYSYFASLKDLDLSIFADLSLEQP